MKKLYETSELREAFSERNPDYAKRHFEVSKLLETWKDKLSSDEYESLENLLKMQIDAESLQCLEDFCYGFKLGMLMCMELFSKNPSTW